MSITDVLRQAHGGELIARLAHLHELAPEDAAAVVDAVVPELSTFVERNTLSRGGLADLVAAIGHGHHEDYFNNPALIGDPRAIEDGNAILGHITGSKDRSRGVADRAAQATGVDSAIIGDMLPTIAGLMMGALSKQVKGGLGEVAARAGGGFLPDKPLPQGRAFPQQQQPQRPQAPQGGGSGSWEQRQDDGGVRMNPRGGLEMPDGLPQNPSNQGGGNGSPRGNEPLPMPGNRIPQVPGNADNPFGDLAEILRRGLGLPGGSGPIMIPLPGGGSFPFPIPTGDGQSGGPGRGPRGNERGGAQMPRGETGGGGFPWPQGGSQGGGQDTGFPWPQGGKMGGGNQGGGGLPMPRGDQGGTGFPWPQGGGQDGGMGGGQQSPLPMPGGGGRGIELPGGQVGGGMLWNVIRSILGAALGFRGGGIMSWLFRMVFMRYGWQILRTILGRGMFGR
jgi:hypothetical protein